MRRRKEIEEGAIEIDRSPLGDLEAEEFYAEGCTSTDVVLVADEEGDGDSEERQSQFDVSCEPQAEPQVHEFESCNEEIVDAREMDSPTPDMASCTFDFSIPSEEWRVDLKAVDELMTKSDSDTAAQAKLFEPLEKAEEGFEVWESGSAKGEDELVS
jgi:hypothetical protein